jgi:hypothetical protein
MGAFPDARETPRRRTACSRIDQNRVLIDDGVAVTRSYTVDGVENHVEKPSRRDLPPRGEIDRYKIPLPKLDFRLQGRIAGKFGLDRRAAQCARKASSSARLTFSCFVMVIRVAEQ